MGVYSNDNLEGLDYRGNDIYSPFYALGGGGDEDGSSCLDGEIEEVD